MNTKTTILSKPSIFQLIFKLVVVGLVYYIQLLPIKYIYVLAALFLPIFLTSRVSFKNDEFRISKAFGFSWLRFYTKKVPLLDVDSYNVENKLYGSNFLKLKQKSGKVRELLISNLKEKMNMDIIKSFRKNTKTGKPSGSSHFIRKIEQRTGRTFFKKKAKS